MSFDPEAVRAFEHAGWNRAAADYEASFATATRLFIDPLLDAAAIGAGDRVLDLCCGPGFVGAAALARGAAVSGLDFSQAMLAEARTRHPAIAFSYGDAESPPFEGGRFDAVVSNFGIHHVPRPLMALAEAHRILRPGGRFAFSIWAGQDENIAWKLVFDAIGRHGDPAASPAPPPGGGFSTAETCLAGLAGAGFVNTGTTLVRRAWRHRDAISLLAALRAGTARMAALIESQPPRAMPAIQDSIEAAAARWRGPAGLAIPIAAIVAHGTRAEGSRAEGTGPRGTGA